MHELRRAQDTGSAVIARKHHDCIGRFGIGRRDEAIAGGGQGSFVVEREEEATGKTPAGTRRRAGEEPSILFLVGCFRIEMTHSLETLEQTFYFRFILGPQQLITRRR